MSFRYAVRTLTRRLGYDVTRRSDGFPAFVSDLLNRYEIRTVVDVGANEGQFAQWLRYLRYCGRIISFEPVDDAYRRLERHAEQDDEWITRNVALGASASIQTMHISGNSQSSSLLPMLDSHRKAAPSSRYVREHPTAVAPLADFRQLLLGQAWLKIDTQGSELAVVAGAAPVLDYIRVIQVELSLRPLYEHAATFAEVVNTLENLGYSFSYIKPGFQDPASGTLLQADGIFVREASHN